MPFINHLNVNIELLLVTFLDDLMAREIAKKEGPGQPGQCLPQRSPSET